MNPCQPSPCGPNAECRVVNDSPSCSCLPEFVGSPPNCRPECANNGDCSSQLACVRQKCQDPCIGSCGDNARCHVVSHTAMCVCNAGYRGDPFTGCSLQLCKLGRKDTKRIDSTLTELAQLRLYSCSIAVENGTTVAVAGLQRQR